MSPSPIPQGVPAVRPYLFMTGAAEAISFYERAFGAKERIRLEVPGGTIAHAEVQIGDSVVAQDVTPEQIAERIEAAGPQS